MSNNRPGQHGGVCKLGHFTSVFTDCYKSVNRTVQKTEECFPGRHHATMHLTPIDDDVQKMTDDANKIAKRHKRIVSLVQQYLKHGPIAMTKEYIYEGTESWKKRTSRNNEQMQLGSQLIFAGRALGDLTLYGNVMLDVGMAQQDIGHEELKFVTMTALSLLIPMKNFINTDLHNISKQKQALMHRRLELDRAIGKANRSSKSDDDHSDHGQNADPQTQARIQNAQTAFDNQQCITRQACYSVEKEKKRMIVAFLRFIECQLVYMRRCAAISESVKGNLIKKMKMESLSDLQWPDSNFPYVKILDDEPPVVCPRPVYAKIPPKPAGDGGTGLCGFFPIKKKDKDKEKDKHHSTSDSTQTSKQRRDTFDLIHNRNDSPEDALENPEAEFDIGSSKVKPRKNTFELDRKRNDGPDESAAAQKSNNSKSAKMVKFDDCFRIPGLHKKHVAETGEEKEEEYTTVIEQTKKVTQTSTGSNKIVETKKVTQTSTGLNKENNRVSQNNTSAMKDSMTGPTHEDVGSTSSQAGSEEGMQENVVKRTLTGSINNIKKTLGSLRSSFKKANPEQNSETALIEEPQQTEEDPDVNQAQNEAFDTEHNEEEPFRNDGTQAETQNGASGEEGEITQEEPQAKLSGGSATMEALTNVPVKGGRLSSAGQVEPRPRKTDENIQAEATGEEAGRPSKQSKPQHERPKQQIDENIQAGVPDQEEGRRSRHSKPLSERPKQKTDEDIQVETPEEQQEKKHSSSKHKHSVQKDENAQGEADTQEGENEKKHSRHKHSNQKDEDIQAETSAQEEKKHSKHKHEKPKQTSKDENTQAETADQEENEEQHDDKHSKHKNKKHHKGRKHKSNDKENKDDHENEGTDTSDLDEPKPQAEKVSVEEVVNGVSLGKAEVPLADRPEPPFPKKRISKSIVEVVIHSQKPSTVSSCPSVTEKPK